MSLPTAERLAKAVAEALTASGLATANHKRYPKYALADLADVTVDVVPFYPVSVDAHDRGSTARDVQVLILVQQRCEKTDDAKVDSLTLLLEDLAEWMAMTEIDGAGQPVEPVDVDRSDDLLDGGHFIGYAMGTYRVFREWVPS